MDIKNISIEVNTNYQKISCRIGFQDLWFRIPADFEVDPLDATPFLIVGLLPAMMLGEDIIIDSDYYVDPLILKNCQNVQALYHSWNPVFQLINIKAQSGTRTLTGSGIGSFFSGGVDGTYTLFKHYQDIEHLISINGFDFSMGNHTWKSMVDRNRAFGEQHNKSLVAIETNYKIFMQNYGIDSTCCFGSCLAAIALLLGLDKAYISSGGTYSNLLIDGSHPLIDQYWSTKATILEHTGLEADRAQKLKFLKQQSFSMENLWVCWRGPKENCGRCSKCIRTYVALRLNGISDSMVFNQPVDVSQLANQTIEDEIDYQFFSGFRDLAVENEDHTIEKILNRMLGKYKIREFLKDMDSFYFKSCIQQWRFKRRKQDPEYAQIGAKPKDTDNKVRELTRNLKSVEEITKYNAIIGSIYFYDKALDKDTAKEIPGDSSM